MQNRKMSLVESITNYLIGYWLAVWVQMVLYPLYGINLEFAAQAEIAGYFTVVSIARSYAVRRFFNMATVRGWW